MLKNLWQKIKQNHLLLMILCCLIPIVLIVAFLDFFKGSNYWIWLILLLCPLLHIWMMKGMGHKDEKCHKNDTVTFYKCPVCRLKYREKEWAEKCEKWCRKNKSCNLEIIKHALKISD